MKRRPSNVVLIALVVLGGGCSGAQVSPACQEREWETRVAKEHRLEMRYPESEFLTGLGEGKDYESAVQAATAALSRKVSVVVESELKDARSFYRQSDSSSYVETLDEVIVTRTAFSYGTLIQADATDAFPWCGRFVAAVRAARPALMEEMGRKLGDLYARLRAAADSSLEAGARGETKPYMAGYRDFLALLSEVEVEAAQLRAVSQGVPEELAGARELLGQLESEGRRLRDALKPCLELSRTGEVPQESQTLAADALAQALAALGLPGTIGNCGQDDGLWLAKAVLEARCKSGAASAICTAVVTVTLSQLHTQTVLATFELRGTPERGLYSEAEAAGASFRKLLESEELKQMMRQHIHHLIPLNSPPTTSRPSR
jgi:hypothetical protein